jgi:1-acyl-sn-glycerol-3-phosphate acyltransferase
MTNFLELFWDNLPGIPNRIKSRISDRLPEIIHEDLLDIETWKGLWFMMNYSIQYQADFVKRRFSGEFETDEWGLDWEFVEVVRPFFDFMYYRYWRVEASGLDQIPDTGRALLVSNHSGQLPWDGAMVTTAIYNEHPYQRLSRNLYATWFPTLPFISTILERGGQVMATVENGTRLLEQDELVAVFPEGYKGVSKLFRDRYRLARFGRGGFVKMALSTQAPIIPVSVVGAEETYVSIYKSQSIARLIGFPFFPISLRFPWLGLLGFIPFPTKWYIDFGPAIPTDGYGEEAAQNLVLVSQLSDQVRNIIQEMINTRLTQRKSIFRG